MGGKLVIILFITIPLSILGQSSLNVELLDHWHDGSLMANSSEVRYNDCWGFTFDGQEYAVAGSTEGMHFFSITNDNKLVQLDSITGRDPSSMVVHRDVKKYGNYVYAVCEEGESSLQIIDISYLPDSVHLVADNDTTFAQVHNLYIDSANALMYACIITPKVGGMLQSTKSMEVFSLADPVSPQLVYSGPNDIPEVHDAYVVNNIAYLNCGFDGLRVYDFTTPSNPVFLQNMSFYQDQGYNHQGWMTPDGKTYVFGDETEGKRLKKCDVDVDHTISVQSIFGSNHEENSVPHNVMLSNEFAYVAYYNEGLRVFDLRTATPTEIAHYDTYPQDSPFKMYGAWGIYSKLPSGRLLVSDRINGLFLLGFREDIFLNPPNEDVSLYPNPIVNGEVLTIRTTPEINEFTVEIFDLAGHRVYDEFVNGQTFLEARLQLTAGMYLVNILHTNYLDEQVTEKRRFIVK